MKKQASIISWAISGLVAALLLHQSASADDSASMQTASLGRDAVLALDGPLSTAFGRSMHGELMYHEQQAMAVVVGINYVLEGKEAAGEWQEKVQLALKALGTLKITALPLEVRAEHVQLGERQAMGTQFTASDDTLSAVVIYLSP